MIHFLPLLIACCFGTARRTEHPAPKEYRQIHQEAAAFCSKNGMNTDYYFLVDLSIHSGKNRFFICDLKQGKILDQNLVTHGACDVETANASKWEKAKFSNNDNSHCSAKGKYKIGSRDYSGWGIHVKYWLHGLDPTNSNAEDRIIVLHSWTSVKNSEVYPSYSPLSWGCPAVSDEFMTKLDERLKQSGKPVLLWIVG